MIILFTFCFLASVNYIGVNHSKRNQNGECDNYPIDNTSDYSDSLYVVRHSLSENTSIIRSVVTVVMMVMVLVISCTHFSFVYIFSLLYSFCFIFSPTAQRFQRVECVGTYQQAVLLQPYSSRQATASREPE